MPVTTATARTTTRKAAAAYFNLRLTADTALSTAFQRLIRSPYDFLMDITRHPGHGLPALRHEYESLHADGLNERLSYTAKNLTACPEFLTSYREGRHACA